MVETLPRLLQHALCSGLIKSANRGAGHEADSFPNRVVHKTRAGSRLLWESVMSRRYSKQWGVMNLSIYSLLILLSAKLWLGPRLTRNLLETRSWHCTAWVSLSKWRLLIGPGRTISASDWSEHSPQILSDKLVQLGPAALADEGKNCQSSFNFYKTLSFSFSIWFYLSSQNILLKALLTDCCSACGHQWSMSQSFYLSRLKSLNLMRVYVWYFSHNIDTSLLTRVITQQTWGQCQCHVQLLVHVAVTFRLYLKPQLNLLEKVRCVWNQILIDVQSVKANRKSQSINALQSAHHLESMSRLGNHSRTAAPCQHNYLIEG